MFLRPLSHRFCAPASTRREKSKQRYEKLSNYANLPVLLFHIRAHKLIFANSSLQTIDLFCLLSRITSDAFSCTPPRGCAEMKWHTLFATIRHTQFCFVYFAMQIFIRNNLLIRLFFRIFALMIYIQCALSITYTIDNVHFKQDQVIMQGAIK